MGIRGLKGENMKVAITASQSKTQFYINQAYVQYVQTAGFEPILVTPLSDINTIANDCDFLLLPGGIDVDPIYYEEDNLNSQSVDPLKDMFERDVLHTFINKHKKVLGICRGFQLIVREYMLYKKEISKFTDFLQHIPYHNQCASSLSAARTNKIHNLTVNTNILYNDVDHKFKFKTMFVNSMHHQCLYLINKPLSYNLNGMELVALTKYGLEAKNKGFIIEAINIPLWKCRGVQWHPEELMDVKLLQSFFLEHKNVAQAGGNKW